jgi:trimethylamine--corrinoid protein Co-methyltransferase
MRATQMIGQMARFYGLPLRSSGGCAAAVPDGQAMWETSNSLWAAVQSGANMVYHAAGWLDCGLIASPEKFIMDCEVLQMIQRYCEAATFATREEDLAFELIKEVGAGGHYSGTQHLPDRTASAIHAPIVSDWRTYEAMPPGAEIWSHARAHAVFKQIMADFKAPDMNGDHQEDLARFVAMRKQEGGVS